MQIDFHHTVTYVVARLGGLSPADARVVAHASQYVDDATHDGPIDFKTGERYVRCTSAHKTLDFIDNGNQEDNRLVWMPFHFLPGNEVADNAAEDALYHRFMCKPDSAIARKMMRDVVQRKDLPFALQRLGIALHTYVDTWAHQQFVGAICDLNRIESIALVADPAYKRTQAFDDLDSGTTRIQQFVANHLPVGHAGALTLPDLPFLKWSFTRENGEVVQRDNPTDFLAAARAAFNAVRRYVQDNVDLPDADLPAADAQLIDKMLRTTILIEGEDRHDRWLKAIQQGAFSFGPVPDLDYVEHGVGSWKHDALGEDPIIETEGEQFDYTPAFLTSNWKLFHDAVQHQRLYVLHELLPRFGLCAS